MVRLTYAVQTVGMLRTEVLIAVTIGGLVSAAIVPLAGYLGDRYGRQRIYVASCGAFGLGVFPAFAGIASGSLVLLIVVLVLLLGVIYGVQSGSESTLFAELLPTQTRYTGLSLVYRGSGIYASGLTPSILTLLLAAASGSPWLAGAFLVATALISIVVTYRLKPVVDL